MPGSVFFIDKSPPELLFSLENADYYLLKMLNNLIPADRLAAGLPPEIILLFTNKKYYALTVSQSSCLRTVSASGGFMQPRQRPVCLFLTKYLSIPLLGSFSGLYMYIPID